VKLQYHILIEQYLNPLNAELNPICHLLALLGAHLFFHVSRIRVKGTEQASFWSEFELIYIL
jgi:hypothetical protein